MAATTTITRVNINKAARGGAGTLNSNIPTGTQIGDVVIFEVLCTAAGNIPATPFGLTLIDSGSTTWSYATYYRVWDGTEGTITFTFTGSGGTILTRTYRGVSNANPIHKHSINRTATNNSPVATGVTTTVDGCMLLYSTGTGTVTATSFTDPSGFSTQDFYSAGTAGSSSGSELLQTSAGATGNKSGTWVGITNPTSYSSLIALTPASVWPTDSLVQNVTPDSYSWVCPPGVYGIDIEGWGGGGGSSGGLAATSKGGSGGGGGEYRKYVSFKTTPGTTYFIIVGKAGTAGAASAGTGGNGQGSAFINLTTGTIILWAKGGVGGIGDGGAGGAGGDTGTGGSIHYKGGTGVTATSSTGGAGAGCGGPTSDGGNGSGTTGGTAGTGGNTGAGGNGGSSYTVGGTPGGGGGGPNSTSSPVGKAGGPGAIRLTNPDRDPLGITFQLM